MDNVFIEKNIIQVKQTIENLEKYTGSKEDYRQKILMDAKSFLKQMEEMKEKLRGEL